MGQHLLYDQQGFMVTPYMKGPSQEEMHLAERTGSGLKTAPTVDLPGQRQGGDSKKGHKGRPDQPGTSPRHQHDQGVTSDQEPEEKPEDADIQQDKKILIVEDDRVSLLYIRELIELLDIPDVRFQVDYVFTGEKAVEFTRKYSFDVVLMDLKLPGIDGLEATREIKKYNPFLPVIAQTAFALSGDEKKAYDAGCDDYLAKPISEKELVEKFRKFLDLS